MASIAKPTSQANSDRYALYGRVSTEDQHERQTVQGQLGFLRNYCQLFNLDIADEYIDEGISGAVPLHDRPEGRRLLEDAGQKFSVVIVYRLDRLGRSLAALISAHNELAQANVTIRSATEPFDTSTPIGTFLFQLLGGLAELERSTISERMAMGRDRVAKQGKWTQCRLPFGYDVDDRGILIKSPHLVPVLNVPEWELARDIIGRVANGESLIAVARWLNTLGVPPVRRFVGGTSRQDSGAWSSSRLHRMIHSGTHTGKWVMETKNGPIESDVPAIVSFDVWEAAKRQLVKNRTMARRNAKNFYLLRGLIKCQCGANYTGQHPPQGQRLYRCNMTQKPNIGLERMVCKSRSVPAGWLEDLIWADCRSFIQDPGQALADAQAQLGERLNQSAELESQRRTLLHRIAEKEAERERAMTLYRRGRASLTETESQLDAITHEENDLRGLLAAIRSQEELAQAFKAQLSGAASLLGQLRDRLEEIEAGDDAETKRQVVELLVSKIAITTVGEGRTRQASVEIVYTFGPKPVRLQTSIESTTPWRTQDCVSLELAHQVVFG